MEDLTVKPKLRPLEAFPVQENGQNLFVIRDPFHYSDAVLSLSPMGALIVKLMDGGNTLLDIQTVLSRSSKEIFPSDKIHEVLRVLDECFFLENDKFADRKRNVEKSFAQSPTRPSAMAGRSYPADPKEIRALLDKFFSHPDGAGVLPADGAAGIISPHIDFTRGGPTYTHAYRSLANSQAETFVIFGISHSGGATPLIPTRKDFETPLGKVETDRGILDLLEKYLADNSAWRAIYAAEFAHAYEHSIEFQVVFLQYLLSNPPRPFRILPILCAFSHEEVQEERLSGGGPIRAFLNALTESTRESGQRVAYIAGVDFAHVGAQFGDDFPVREKELASLKDKDEQMMAFLAGGELEEFHRFICDESNSRRVCGYPALYTFLSVLPENARADGRVLKYGQWPDANGTVTFGSLAFGSTC